MGAVVEWNAAAKTAVVSREGTSVYVTNGDNSITVINDKTESRAIDAPAKIIGGRLMIPLRAVSEALGASVNWSGETKSVIIND
jgi:DNA-binding beta-propeller fold protein YncE